MELAKAWFRGENLSVPIELQTLLESHPQVHGLELLTGVPEKVTPLPQRGEGRNHDLALVGVINECRVTICVEAKADEAFGNESVHEYWMRALQRRESGFRTGAPERVQALLEMVGETGGPTKETAWGGVRYQLLAGLCGTVLQAKRDSSSLAVFVVHEFHTDLTLDENLMRNHNDFGRLLAVLLSETVTAECNRLYGPFPISGIGCLIGKVVAVVE